MPGETLILEKAHSLGQEGGELVKETGWYID